MMSKAQICEMMSLLAEMINNVIVNSTRFVEISTYVRNHCPDIEPEFVEAFRDILCPLMRKFVPTEQEKKLDQFKYLEELYWKRAMTVEQYEEWLNLGYELSQEGLAPEPNVKKTMDEIRYNEQTGEFEA